MSTLSRKPVIGFDLDGTLVDSVKDIARALNAAMADVGLPAHSVDVVRGFVGDGARDLVKRALEKNGDNENDVDTVLMIFREHYGKDPVGETQAYPWVLQAITELKRDFSLAVVTNKPGVFARPIVSALFPFRFDIVAGPDDLGVQKPDPRVLEEIARHMKAPVRVFVGDGDTDIDVAKRAGIPSVGVTWGLKPDCARRADFVVDHARDLAVTVRRALFAANRRVTL